MAPWYRERHPDDHSLKLKTEWLKNDIFRMNAANNWDNVNKIDWLTRCRFTLYLEWFHWKIYIFWYSHNPNAVRVPEIFRCISTLAILICLNLPPVNTKPSVILTQWPPDTTVSEQLVPECLTKQNWQQHFHVRSRLAWRTPVRSGEDTCLFGVNKFTAPAAEPGDGK